MFEIGYMTALFSALGIGILGFILCALAMSMRLMRSEYSDLKRGYIEIADIWVGGIAVDNRCRRAIHHGHGRRPRVHDRRPRYQRYPGPSQEQLARWRRNWPSSYLRKRRNGGVLVAGVLIVADCVVMGDAEAGCWPCSGRTAFCELLRWMRVTV